MMTSHSHPLPSGDHDPARKISPEGIARNTEDKLRASTRAVGNQLDRVSWVDLAAGLAIGFGLGFLACSRRSPHSLSDVMSDSVGPWASRRAHGALDLVRRSKPVSGLTEAVERLRAS